MANDFPTELDRSHSTSRNKDFERFAEMVRRACLGIAGEYFHMPVAGADAVYRERVYCYELYHQLRMLWDQFAYSLGGEVDKAGHPVFRDGRYAKAKPDYLVHVPGNMDHNLAVVEIKAATTSAASLRSDLAKLAGFREEAKYFGGILLVFGDRGEPETFATALAKYGALGPQLRVLYHRLVYEVPLQIIL